MNRQADLFDAAVPVPDAADLHDPGGAVRIRLASGMQGAATFSPCGRYRPWLSRSWDDTLPTILWVGMNPSTATAAVDDPTIRTEIAFSRLWGFGSYIKTNVMDYRATHPKDLLVAGVVPRSDENLPTIREMARKSSRVMMAFGALHARLLHFGTETTEALQSDGHDLLCLAYSKAGLPRHPLYIRRETQPVPYPKP